MEEYKLILESNEKYKISNKGNVLDVKKNKLVKQQQRNGTRIKWFVRLFIENKYIEKYVDKLVCESFIRKLDRDDIVNHKNGNILDNNLENLEIKKANDAKNIVESPKFNDNEEWKYIKEYENRYMVSNLGHIYSQLTNDLLIPYNHNCGYYAVGLANNKGKRKTHLMHILIAKTFLGDIKKNEVVDHIDTNKLNNILSNLRIVSRTINGLNRKIKENNIIQQYDLNNNLIKEYNTVNDAAKELNLENFKNIYNCLIDNKSNTAYGFIWKYKNKKKKEIIKTIDNNFVKIKISEDISLDNYSINKNGQVFSILKNRILTSTNLGGYKSVNLCVNGKPKSFKIHRLLMFTFKNNIDNKPVVNHKDENKLNNDLDNLEWMTEQENCAHSRGKKVRQIDMKTNECIQVFNSVGDVYRQFNKQYSSTIRKVCNGQRKSLFGYKWEWDN